MPHLADPEDEKGMLHCSPWEMAACSGSLSTCVAATWIRPSIIGEVAIECGDSSGNY